jgi:murein DD-endopeptidase MepM/ murein hydrolase activator NlpD
VPSDQIHKRKNRWKYRILLLPDEDAGKSWNFRMGLPWLGLSLIAYSLLIGALTIVLLKWSPLGVWIPVKNPELERRYGRLITSLRDQLSRVDADVAVLKRYNVKLRQALGAGIPDTEESSSQQTLSTSEQERTFSSVESRQSAEESEDRSDVDATSGVAMSAEGRPTVLLATSGAEGFRQNLPLRFPATGYITRKFEPSFGHPGIDIAGRQGSPVVAAAEGYVLFAGWTYDAGYMMILAHEGGYFTYYKHNQSLLKSANTFVKRGEPIALLGNTGAKSQGPHLHFEVWKGGAPLDPSEYVLSYHLN